TSTACPGLQWPACACPARTGSRREVVLEDVCRQSTGGEGPSREAERPAGSSSAPPATWPDVVQTQRSTLRGVPPGAWVCLCVTRTRRAHTHYPSAWGSA